MNILNLLTNEKKVAGIEISDLVIRIAYFSNAKKKRASGNEKIFMERELVLFETPLPPNVVSGGVVLDKELLGKILKNAWEEKKLKKRSAIVSIQEDKIYSRNLRFPKTENQEHLKQAVGIALDFQVPFNKDEVYVDWENTENFQNGTKVLISCIPKKIVNDYIVVMDNAGINMVALESQIASISRSILLKEKETTLINKENQNSTTLFCLKDNILRFSRTIPSSLANKDTLISTEILKIKKYLESETNSEIKELPLIKAQTKNEYLNKINIKTNSQIEPKWLISLGSALRGDLPGGKDTQISLLPVGTVKSYEYQKSKIFITFIRNIIVGVSLFFLFAFLAAYFLTLSLAERFNNSESNISVNPISSDITQKESLISEVNELTSVSYNILSNTLNWSVLIDEIKARATDGIVVLNFRAISVKEKITISGISKDRETLNLFKKSLQESSYLSGVELPINNLEQKGDIPFSISFLLRDPSMLFYK